MHREGLSLALPDNVIWDYSDKKFRKFLGDDDRVYISKSGSDISDELEVFKSLGKDTHTFFKLPEWKYQDNEIITRFYPPTLGHKALNIGEKPTLPHNFQTYLPIIIQASLEMMSLDYPPTLPKDEDYIKQNYTYRTSKWSERILEIKPNLQNTLTPLQNKIRHFETLPKAFSHGNYWQDHWGYDEVNNKLVIFDFGTATLVRPRFYDLLFFAHRLETAFERPDLAEDLLTTVPKFLSETEKSKFETAILPILSMRAIGGIYDAINDKRLSLNLAINFAQRLCDEYQEKGC